MDALIWDGKQVPVIGGPVFAVLTGMFVAVIWKDKQELQPGLSFTSKKILQYAVILLGFGLNLAEIAKVGMQSLPINISILVGVGSSICGGSAIAAIVSVSLLMQHMMGNW